MVRRNGRGYFGELMVFPGGAVESIDEVGGASGSDEISHRRAALRELAEETGILVTADGAMGSPEVKDAEFYRWVGDRGIELGVDRLVLISRWVTPDWAPRRFDTRFYLLVCDDPPPVRIDLGELVESAWVTPGAAIDKATDGSWPMVQPTVTHLRWLAGMATADEARQSASGADARSLSAPRVVEDGSLLQVLMPLGSS